MYIYTCMYALHVLSADHGPWIMANLSYHWCWDGVKIVHTLVKSLFLAVPCHDDTYFLIVEVTF
jgi:hypothetical protein